jgi:hypothetical protein
MQVNEGVARARLYAFSTKKKSAEELVDIPSLNHVASMQEQVELRTNAKNTNIAFSRD